MRGIGKLHNEEKVIDCMEMMVIQISIDPKFVWTRHKYPMILPILAFKQSHRLAVAM